MKNLIILGCTVHSAEIVEIVERINRVMAGNPARKLRDRASPPQEQGA